MINEEIIRGNANLIYKIASKFYGVEKEDLFQAGVLGLLKAYQNYHHNSNCKFSSYAYDYIYGEMYTLVNSRTIKVHKDILKLYRIIEKTRYALAQKFDRVPSNKEVAEFLELSEYEINEAVMAGNDVMSLDKDQNMPFIDAIKVDEKINVDDQILLNEGFDVLSKDEKNIIKARYFDDLTQSEVARKLSMTQVMVSRYEKRGIGKMQQFMNL